MVKVLIYGDQLEGKLSSNAREALSFGNRLVQSTSGEIGAVLVGTGAGVAAKEAIACGAEQAFTVENPFLEDYQAELYLEAICTVFNSLMLIF